MIDIVQHDMQLLLRYDGDYNDPRWIDEKLDKHDRVTIKHTFTFTPADLAVVSESDEVEEDSRAFILGVVDNEYYKIDRSILGLKHDLRLFKDMPLSQKTFVAERNISIFRRIDELIDEPIVVGGNATGAIPLSDFEELLANFPTSSELTRYARARIAVVLKDYFGTMSDAQEKLDNYLKRKKTVRAVSRVKFLDEYEPRKFEYVRDELREMLNEAEAYSEREWQRLILDFLLLIFPKYIAVLENLHIKDYYSNPEKPKDRYIDLTLVDACGTIDVVEIKKPFTNCLLSTNKYRDNYTPRTELSGSVMQAEKYLFHLNMWGIEGEREILKKRKGELPENFTIKVTNPKAIIILGRDCDFTSDQMFDFEIMKRKYANIMDIMTYDDLLRRLDNIIAMIYKNSAQRENAGEQV